MENWQALAFKKQKQLSMFSTKTDGVAKAV